MNNKNDRKDFVSQTYFKLIYYSELHSSNYEDRIEIYNKILSENTELTPEEKRSCQDRAQRNTEREKELFKRGKPIGCGYCKLTRYSTRYCENCIIKYLKSFFGTWTSGCDVIDKFIRECQSNSGLPLHIMEWIPFEQFEDIEHLANGGFATIYTATWKRGSILDFNESKRNFVYQGSQKVVLKSLNNSNEHTEKFFEEAKRFIQIRSGDIVNAYGITKIKTSDNSNYAIVMNYFADGNLRDYLKKNHSTLSLQDRVFAIWRICGVLLDVHRQDLIHCDLHSGNILLYTNRCLLTDLGLCGPVEDRNADEVFGIIPYMAPELLQNKKYSKATDIYGLGILMWEIFAGHPPFFDKAYDEQLILEIILNNLRPPKLPEVPNELQNLIYRCLDADPLKRPNIEEIHDIIKKIYCEILENEKLGIEYERKKKRTNEKLVIEDEKKKKRTTVAFDNWQQDSFQSQIIKFDFNDSELKKLSDISVIKSKNLELNTSASNLSIKDDFFIIEPHTLSSFISNTMNFFIEKFKKTK
ncbi:kinase-like domain-containing protein [Gigaspora rosea]|uniref:Kinase-like domain-containing protein n=1 Tax=Gigaspora rosea TaxID=44941 RepID=A0A397VI78_9GLOM|nr:kinase-like domain-containing protein [Gigaspora rosea]